MLENLLKEREEKQNRLEKFEKFWSEKETERKSKQIQVKSKCSWHYDENGKVALDIKNTDEEIQQMGKNTISDMNYDMGYQIAKGIMKDEVEKIDIKIKKLLKEERKIRKAEKLLEQYSMF